MARRGFFTGCVVDLLANLFMLSLFSAVATIATFVMAMLADTCRVYQRRAFQPTIIAGLLWLALGGLVGLWLLTLVAPGTLPLPLAFGGTPLWFITLKLYDVYDRYQDQHSFSASRTGLLDAFHQTHPSGGSTLDVEGALREGVIVGEDIPRD
jgi:hypothetical protein